MSSLPKQKLRRALCAAPLAAVASRVWPVASDRHDLAAVPILVYHRFAPTLVDSMTVRHETFDRHLALLQRLKATVVPLAEAVAWRRGSAELPPRAVALCADDGHRTQAEWMAPALREHGWPMTLFVYPSAISNAPYAMTWAQLAALAGESARFDVQSHTWWHPNLVRDRQRLGVAAFERELDVQLRHSRELLQAHLQRRVSLLAWPFGLTDEAMGARAAEIGYEAAFVLGNRTTTLRDPLYALPRWLMVDAIDARRLRAMLEVAWGTQDAGS